jgi:hypothetical protein
MAAVDAGPQAGKLPYPAGEWEVRYDGVGQLSYSLAARLNSSGVIAPGIDPLLVTPAEPGIQICITQTDAANPVRNIRLYPLGVKSRVLAGEVFSPDFLARLQIYSALRFMDWQRTNNSTQGEFANRALSADARYTTERGVPVEVMVDLANNLQIQPWFNMPQPATDAYVSAFAALVRDRLAPTLPVYVEYSNEIWNDQFTQGRTIGEEGVASFQGLPGSDFDKRLNRFGERTAQICQLWRAAFGAQADRVRCVMAGQAANTYIAQTALECPLSALKPCRDKGIHGLAIAPYVGDHIGLPQLEAAVSAWTGEADGGLSRMFNELNTGTELRHEGLSGMPIVRERISAHAALARSQAVALLAYEGGQHLVGVGEPANNASINTLMDAANRDARMGSLYTSYLQEWASAGGDLFMHFSDVGNFSRFGRWGALEIVTQTSSPKFDALKAFAQNGTGTVLGSQAISFGAAPTLVVGATATVSATGGASGNPVIFSSTTSGVCSASGSNGATITGVTAGTCTIAANQAGNTNFNAAPQVTQNITVSASTSTAPSAPFCSLSASPSSIFPGSSSVLTANCSPQATSFAWTGGTCAGLSTSSCTVTPTAATSYTVRGSSAVGSGNTASATVSIVALPPTFSAGLYDGIYQWSAGNFLSLHQDGTVMIAVIYFNNSGSFNFPAAVGGGTLNVPQLGLFDLMSGQVTGPTATLAGTRFHGACNVTYNFTFNADITITVTRTGVSNTPAAVAAGISCSAIVGVEPTTLIVPKLRFNR